MSSKTRVGGVVAALFGTAVLLGASPAVAQPNTVPAVFAAETLSTANTTMVGSDPYYNVTTGPAGAQKVYLETDIALFDDQRYFIRYDFGGAVLQKPMDLEQFLINSGFGGVTRVQGGGAAEGFAIYRLYQAEFAINTTIELYILDHFAVPGPGSFDFEIGIYSTDQDARNKANERALMTATVAGVISVVRTLSVESNPWGDADGEPLPTANVAAGEENGGVFRRFVPSSYEGAEYTDEQGPLAEITVAVTTETAAVPPVAIRDARDGTAVTERDVYGGMSMTFESDTDGAFSFGSFSVGGDCGPMANLAKQKEDDEGGLAPLMTAGEMPDDASLAVAATGTFGSSVGTQLFCVNVAGNEVAIPAVGERTAPLNGYRMGYELTLANENAPDNVQPDEGTLAAGSIARNGTTVNIAFLSTFEGYRQRLALVNRGSEEAEYRCTEFQFEEDIVTSVTASEEMMRGTIPANGRKVLRMFGDEGHLTIEGAGTRASGTCEIDATAEDVSAMTVQFSSDRLDTTLYAPEPN